MSVALNETVIRSISSGLSGRGEKLEQGVERRLSPPAYFFDRDPSP